MKSRVLWGMVAVILLAFALRVVALGDKSVWWDEAWSAWVAQQPLDQTTFLTASDVHPPLYQWALHVWVRLAGISEFSIRYLSLLWNVLTVALIFAITRRMGNVKAALTAAFFAACSVFMVHWAQETRMYAQAAFFTALVSYAYLRVRPHPVSQTRKKLPLLPSPPKSPSPTGGEGDFKDFIGSLSPTRGERAGGLRGEYPYLIEKLHGSLAWWLTLILSGAAVALTHYLGAFVLVILNLHWLLTLRTQSRGTQNRAFHVRWVGAMLATGAILALWVAYAIGLTRSGSVDSDFNAALAFQLFATLMAAGTSVNLDRYTLVTLVFTVVYFAGVLLYARKWRENALLVLLMAVLPPLAIYALSLPETPFYAPKPEERYMIIFAPLVFAGIGLALAAAARLKRVGAVMALVLGGGLLALYAAAYLRDLDTRYVRDDYATMLQTVDLLAAADDPVLFVSDDRYPLVLYHLNRASDDGYTDLRAVGITSPEGNVQDSVMLDLLDGASRFWVVQIERHFRDPDGLTIAWFDARFERVYHEDIDYNSITLYAADDLESPRADTVLPPVVSEARPFDTVRVGAYGEVTWRYGNTVIRRDLPDEGRLNWGLSQFTVYPAYPNGAYEVFAGDESYPFHVTHSQDALTRPPEVVLNTDFGDLTLLGYDIAHEEVRRGEAFEITLHWHVDEVPQQNYTVFAQLLGPFRNDGPVWASDDRYPADTPTTALWQGLTFTDTHTLAVPPDMPAGTHQAAFGLYLLETGERLPLAQNTAQDAAPNAVIIDGLRVVE